MMSSSDTSTDRVTASVGLIAFINPTPAKPAAKPATTKVEVKTNA
jgi:hypothetical protein